MLVEDLDLNKKRDVNIIFFLGIQYVKICFVFSLFISCHSKSQKRLSEIDKNILVTENSEQKSAEKYQNERIKIMTWNIQNLGRTKSDSVLLEISKIISKSDVVAIQEVVAKDPKGAQAVAKIAELLNRMGSKWDYVISNPTHSPSAYSSERYAYIWQTSKLKLTKKAFLDKELENICVREPYVALFTLRKFEGRKSFYLINFHARKYSDNPKEEIINLIDYPERLGSNNVIVLGDFNLNEGHAVWNEFYKRGFEVALKNTPTTLKRRCSNNNYQNYPIDNFYIRSKDFIIKRSSTIDFVNDCDSLKKKRRMSDHLPVLVELGIK